MNHKAGIKLIELIGEAIIHQLPCVVLPKEATQDVMRKTIRVFMRRHPEIFWFSHQYCFDTATSTLCLKYNFTPQKKDFYSKQIDNVIHFLFQPERLTRLSDLEKVAYVYKWIASYTTYNEYSSFNQTIFSVLINRNSVCTGYAKTAQYLLGLIGIESELIFGQFHADQSEGGRHGWNIVKIDGNWYHVDFCLADPALKRLLNADETPIEQNGLLWNYFCKPTEYVLKNRSIEFLEEYPLCLKSISLRFCTKLITPQKRLSVCKSESGTTSKVYLDSFNKDCVIKTVHGNTNLIDNEVRILQQLNSCKHIVKCKGHTDDGIVLEHLTPWSELLNSHYYHPDESRLKDILIQLSEGLVECADKGITYSDIHYNNVFVSKDGVYKWGDFGIAFPSTPDGSLPSQMFGEDRIALGSRWFMAPETYRKGIFTESSAVYSLTMLAYFVMNDMRPPFWVQNEAENQILNKRLSGVTVDLPANHSRFEDLSYKVCNILNANPNNRIKTFDEFIGLLHQKIDVDIAENVDIVIVDVNNNGEVYCVENPVIAENDNLVIIDVNNDGEVCCVENPVIEDITDCIMMPDFGFSDSADCYATTDIYSDKTVKCDNDLSHDTDTFAMTSGLATDPDLYARTCRNEYKRPPYAATPRHSDNKSEATYFPSNTFETQKACECPSKSSSEIGTMINGSFSRFAKGSATPQVNQEVSSEINACVYAPAEIHPRKSFIVRVYMYRPEEQNDVDSKIKEIDSFAIKKEYKPLDIPVNIGDKLTVQLSLSDGVVCEKSIKSVIWRGRFTDCSFSAKLIDAQQESIDGTAYIFINGVPAGEMLFTIDVVESDPKERYAKIDAHRFSKIFISYAHQDVDKVKHYAAAYRAQGVDYFFDRDNLEGGDIYEEKIMEFIDKSDLFILCWSRNAAKSDYVAKEINRALGYAYPQRSREAATLKIHPISIKPHAELPDSLKGIYNFEKI